MLILDALETKLSQCLCSAGFGIELGLLSSESRNEENLNLLMKQSRTFLSYYPEEFENYDWFIGIVFLICCGVLDKCRDFLQNITSTTVTSLVWCTFGKQFDFIFQENFYLQLNIIIEEINPVVYAALQDLGIPLTALVRKWLGQCFFNILEFEEICNFIIFVVLYPPESTVFYMVALFEHVKSAVCEATYTKSLGDLLKISQFGSFKLSDYVTYIERYIKQYRNIIKL